MGEKSYDVGSAGVRSSIFLPFVTWGLVIIDEEHENTYKQQTLYVTMPVAQPSCWPSMFKAKVLLGTATPGVETYFNATSGKYGLVELKEKDIKISGFLI